MSYTKRTIANPKYRWTNDTFDEDELRSLLNLPADVELPSIIQKQEGQYRREGEFWRLFEDTDYIDFNPEEDYNKSRLKGGY